VIKLKASIERGYGPLCWAKAMGDTGQLIPGTNIVLVADDPRFPDDVFCRRLLDGNVETNVVLKEKIGVSYNWTELGLYSMALAVNILRRFTDNETAIVLHNFFKNEILIKQPEQGFRIKACQIRRWLESKGVS
jgi:hypothetical protein